MPWQTAILIVLVLCSPSRASANDGWVRHQAFGDLTVHTRRKGKTVYLKFTNDGRRGIGFRSPEIYVDCDGKAIQMHHLESFLRPGESDGPMPQSCEGPHAFRISGVETVVVVSRADRSSSEDSSRTEGCPLPGQRGRAPYQDWKHRRSDHLGYLCFEDTKSQYRCGSAGGWERVQTLWLKSSLSPNSCGHIYDVEATFAQEVASAKEERERAKESERRASAPKSSPADSERPGAQPEKTSKSISSEDAAAPVAPPPVRRSPSDSPSNPAPVASDRAQREAVAQAAAEQRRNELERQALLLEAARQERAAKQRESVEKAFDSLSEMASSGSEVAQWTSLAGAGVLLAVVLATTADSDDDDEDEGDESEPPEFDIGTLKTEGLILAVALSAAASGLSVYRMIDDAVEGYDARNNLDAHEVIFGTHPWYGQFEIRSGLGVGFEQIDSQFGRDGLPGFSSQLSFRVMLLRVAFRSGLSAGQHSPAWAHGTAEAAYATDIFGYYTTLGAGLQLFGGGLISPYVEAAYLVSGYDASQSYDRPVRLEGGDSQSPLRIIVGNTFSFASLFGRRENSGDAGERISEKSMFVDIGFVAFGDNMLSSGSFFLNLGFSWAFGDL